MKKRNPATNEINPTAFTLLITPTVLVVIFLAISQPLPEKTVKQIERESISDIISELEDNTQPVELYTTNASNNPGNIRGKDGKFINFSTPEDGYKALVHDITIKISGKSRMMQWKFGKGYKPTIAKLIYVYAPPHENDYKRYVEFISERAGIHPDTVLTAADVSLIIPHMVVMEQGHKNAAIYKQYAGR